MEHGQSRITSIALFVCIAAFTSADSLPRDTGYRGIWYMNQPTNDQYAYKYSGGLGTYPSNHIPFAIYAPEANKTFFVYGGAKPGNNNALVEMVAYYDHATGKVPRPTILLDKKTDDAHDNPVLAIDDAGYIWVFASAHGTSRPAYIYKSDAPYSIDGFTEVLKTNYSYPEPWFIPKRGFLFLQTRYKNGRGLCWQTSADGKAWSEPQSLAHVDEGHYQISWPCGDKVGTAFNYHPRAFQGDAKKHGLNWRTNLYYLETRDMGKTWRTAGGKSVATPVTTIKNPALVHDFESEGTLVYLCDINYDAGGQPVILFVASKSWEPGPGAREWRVIAASGPGPQPYCTGGELQLWESHDSGKTWKRIRAITQNSLVNQTYPRRPLNAKLEFYALWADGNPLEPSRSRLYFTDHDAGNVWRLPETISENLAAPIEVQRIGRE